MSMNPKFICVERSAMTNGANDDTNWKNPEGAKFLCAITGDTEDEVRKKLNAYLSSPEGISHYGVKEGNQPLALLSEGQTVLPEQLVTRNGCFWYVSFEISLYTEDMVVRPPIPHAPYRAYEETN